MEKSSSAMLGKINRNFLMKSQSIDQDRCRLDVEILETVDGRERRTRQFDPHLAIAARCMKAV